MKWIFLLLLAMVVPALASWMRTNNRRLPLVWAFFSLLPFLLGPLHLYVAPISWPLWTGHAKGVEISLMDAIALAIILSRPGALKPKPFHLAFLFYLMTVCLSIFQADQPMASFFYAWQIARMIVVFTAVVSICEDERGAKALITGMVIGICIQAGVTFQERLSGAIQTAGTFSHQNQLGMITHFVVFPSLALLLAGERGWVPWAGPASGAITAIFTASRATIGLAGAGYAGLFLLSVIRKATSRKMAIAALGFAALAVAAPLAMASLERRFDENTNANTNTEYDERAAFQKAAWLMIHDHPMGVGANQYAIIANTGGYSAKADVAWQSGSRSTNVHNLYLLTAAETGYIGLIAFLIVLLRAILVAFHCAWRNRSDRRGDLLLGLGVALVVAAFHSFYEWIFVTFQVEYMFAMNVGMVVGIALQLGYWKKWAPKSVARSAARSGRPRMRGDDLPIAPAGMFLKE